MRSVMQVHDNKNINDIPYKTFLLFEPVIIVSKHFHNEYSSFFSRPIIVF